MFIILKRNVQLTLLFLTTFFFASPAISANFPEIVFILDGSGSMWGQIDGTPKMESAKDVMEILVPSLPPEVKTGLYVYGHREKGNCKDIEMVIPPGSSDRDELVERVLEINPKGKTPIAASVKLVVDAIKNNENETTIALISDGEETCDTDPCGVVKKLKESGVKFVLHVVGFDVNDEQQKQLSCLATAGGGLYFGADNTNGLIQAFDTIKHEVAQKVAKAKTTTKKVVSKLGKLNVKLHKNSQISIAGIKLIRAKDGKTIKDAKLTTADSTHPLLADEYKVVMKFANANYAPPTDVETGAVTIKGGETTVLDFAALSFNVAPKLTDLNVKGVTLIHSDSGKPYFTISGHGNSYYIFKSKPVLAGTYDVAINYYRSPQSSVVARGVVLKAGKENMLTFDSGIILKRTESTDVVGWDLIPSGSSRPMHVVKRGHDNQEPMWRAFIAPPGLYDLKVYIRGMEEPLPAGVGIEIKKGELLEFDTGM